jgi:hypothetical protein
VWTKVGAVHVSEKYARHANKWRERYSALQREKMRWVKEKQEMSANYHDLIQKLEIANQRIGDLENGFWELPASPDIKSRTGTGKETEAAARIEVLECKLNKALDANKKLKGIIMSKSNDKSQTIDDGTIIGKYVELRVQIQRIVAKYFDLDPKKRPNTPRNNNLSSLQRQFYNLWNTHYTDDQIRKRARALIFGLLLENIMKTSCFGFTNVQNHGIESALADFERRSFRLPNGNSFHNKLTERY